MAVLQVTAKKIERKRRRCSWHGISHFQRLRNLRIPVFQLHTKGSKNDQTFGRVVRLQFWLAASFCLSSQVMPDEPFHNFEAYKSDARRSWITHNSSIHGFWGSKSVKGLVGWALVLSKGMATQLNTLHISVDRCFQIWGVSGAKFAKCSVGRQPEKHACTKCWVSISSRMICHNSSS